MRVKFDAAAMPAQEWSKLVSLELICSTRSGERVIALFMVEVISYHIISSYLNLRVLHALLLSCCPRATLSLFAGSGTAASTT